MPRKKKDPDMPKRPLSSYMFYSKDRRPKLQEEQPNLQFGEYSKLIAEEWKGLEADQKEKYLEMSKKDKERYEEALKEYKEKKKNEPPPPVHDFDLHKNFTTQDRIQQHQNMQMRQQQMAGRVPNMGPRGYPYPGGQFGNQYMNQMGGFNNMAMPPAMRQAQQQQQQQMLQRFGNPQAQYLMQQQQQQPNDSFAGRLPQMANPYGNYYPASYPYQHPGLSGPHNSGGQEQSNQTQGEGQNSRPRSNTGNADQSPQALYNQQMQQHNQQSNARSPNFANMNGSNFNMPSGMNSAAYLQGRPPYPGYGQQGAQMQGYQAMNMRALAQMQQQQQYSAQQALGMPKYSVPGGQDSDGKAHQMQGGQKIQQGSNPDQLQLGETQRGVINQYDGLANFAQSRGHQNQQGAHEASIEPWQSWEYVQKGNYGLVFICDGDLKGKYGFYKEDDDQADKAVVEVKDSGENLSLDYTDIRRPPQVKNTM